MIEDDKKPFLKIVSISSKIEEKKSLEEREKEDELKEKLKINSKALKLYAESRELFSEMTDFELQTEAVGLLRKAFLLAMNPLSHIDSEYDYIEVDFLDE